MRNNGHASRWRATALALSHDVSARHDFIDLLPTGRGASQRVQLMVMADLAPLANLDSAGAHIALELRKFARQILRAAAQLEADDVEGGAA